MSGERLQELSLEYALGTLEGEELEELEDLIESGDPAAKAAISAAYQTVAALALAAPEAEASPRLRETLLAKTRPAEAVPLQRFSAAAWALAAAAGVCAVLFWQQLQTTRNVLRDLQARLDDVSARQEDVTAQNARYRQILDILSAPDTLTIELDAPSQARIHAYWNDRQGLVVAGTNMPQPEPGRELQLWVVPRSGAPESVEVFGPDEDGNALILANPRTSMSEANALAITDEPAGGSPGPTTTPIWAGRP